LRVEENTELKEKIESNGKKGGSEVKTRR